MIPNKEGRIDDSRNKALLELREGPAAGVIPRPTRPERTDPQAVLLPQVREGLAQDVTLSTMTTTPAFHAGYQPHAISDRQMCLLEQTARYWRKHGFSPSLRELAAVTQNPSISTVARNLRSLWRQSLLTFYPTISRSIVLTAEGWRLSGYDRPCCS